MTLTPMHVQAHTGLPDTAAWAQFVRDTVTTDLYSTPDWYRLFVDTVVGESAPIRFLLACDDAMRIVAALPLWVRRAPGPFRTECLTALTNYYSCLYEPMVIGDKDAALAGMDAIAQHFVDERRTWSSLELGPLPSDNVHIQRFVTHLQRAGYAPRQSTAFGNWILPCDGLDFETYFAGRRKKMRSTIRSKTKQLTEQHGLRYTVAKTRAEAESALAAYQVIYASSWKNEEPYPRFIPGLVEMLADQGKLRLGVLYLDDTPAAAQLWYVHDNIAYIYKLAYDAQFARHSVGTLLTMELIRRALKEDHVTCIDFLSGDDAHKRHWMSERRERIRLEFCNPSTPYGLWLTARRKLGAIKRRLLPDREVDLLGADDDP